MIIVQERGLARIGATILARRGFTKMTFEDVSSFEEMLDKARKRL